MEVSNTNSSFIKTKEDQQFAMKIKNKLKNNLIIFILSASILFLFLLLANVIPFVNPSSGTYVNIIYVFSVYIIDIFSGASPSSFNYFITFFMLFFWMMVCVVFLINAILDIITASRYLKKVRDYTLDEINYVHANIYGNKNASSLINKLDFKKKTQRLSISYKVTEIISIVIIYGILISTFFYGIEVNIGIFIIPLFFLVIYLTFNIIYLINKRNINKLIQVYINENNDKFQ